MNTTKIDTAAEKNPLPGALVITALRAMDVEARKRGEMFPQTLDEQREDTKAVRNVIESLEFYTSPQQCDANGWPLVNGWPALPASAAGGPTMLMRDALEELAQGFDGCMVEASGGDIDVGEAIRTWAAQQDGIAALGKSSPPARIDADKLQREILNLPRNYDFGAGDIEASYNSKAQAFNAGHEFGHRDARHAAAERVSEALGGGDTDGGNNHG